MLSTNLAAALRCSNCDGELVVDERTAKCSDCGHLFVRENDQWDLRPPAPREVMVPFTVGEEPLSDDSLEFGPLEPRAVAEVDFSGLDVPNHLTPTLLSHFPKASARGALALDLGCGHAVHQGVVEHAGFEWVGIDYSYAAAPILADGHALPFADDSFEFIVSIAVLEHIRYPFVMMREAHRVLKPGGRFVGTVAFLEPFHEDSHYHHTHLGTLNVLQHAGFDVEIVASDPDWRVLGAQAYMSLFPGLPRRIGNLLVAPLDLVHRAWWRFARLLKKELTPAARYRRTAGAFTFIATKSS